MCSPLSSPSSLLLVPALPASLLLPLLLAALPGLRSLLPVLLLSPLRLARICRNSDPKKPPAPACVRCCCAWSPDRASFALASPVLVPAPPRRETTCPSRRSRLPGCTGVSADHAYIARRLKRWPLLITPPTCGGWEGAARIWPGAGGSLARTECSPAGPALPHRQRVEHPELRTAPAWLGAAAHDSAPSMPAQVPRCTPWLPLGMQSPGPPAGGASAGTWGPPAPGSWWPAHCLGTGPPGRPTPRVTRLMCGRGAWEWGGAGP